MATFLTSKTVETAVNEISKLPGIGRRSALRMALHLLKQESIDVEALGQAIISLRQNTTFCKVCNNISDHEVCEICSNPKRNQRQICVVEDIRDVIAIENTNQYSGVYHVLGGIISPMDGIGPSDISIEPLLNRLQKNETEEVIIALKGTMEGDTTAFYIYKQLKSFELNISTIARGIGIGDELEYTDELSLGRSILNRVPYLQTVNINH